MNVKDLEKMIADRANNQVQLRIRAFKQAIESALNQLTGVNAFTSEFGEYENYLKFSENDDSRGVRAERAKLLSLALKDRSHDGSHTKWLPWPENLWRREEEQIRKELLSKMDLMQQLLLQPDRGASADDAPRPEPVQG